jgi:leucyl aminopeptidase
MNDGEMKFIFQKKSADAPGVTRVRVTEEKEDEVVRTSDGSREILLGVGPKNDMTRRKLFLLARRAVSAAKGKKISDIAIDIAEWTFPELDIADAELGELLAVNFCMADFSFDEFKEKPEDGFPELKKLTVTGSSKGFETGVKRGIIIGEEVNRSRYIATMPGGDMTPAILAAHAKSVAKGLPIAVKILGVSEMKKLRMGGVLGVGQGSKERPKFIIMEYRGGRKAEKPIVLVGKGVTFDTGGLNLKPETSMGDMHLDMSGGAAVIHALCAAVRLGVKRNIIVLVPAVENMPSGESYRPGDIIRSMSGKTIEVANTDAEGRIILADALTYAKRYDPSLVVDVATLTGAAVVALGERASAIFTKDETFESRLRKIGEDVGDFVWPLPLWDEYDEDIKGTFGDVANLGKTRWGGAITAAAFLKQFAEGYPWVHIDIAPRMTPVEGEFLAKGSAGAPIRLLVRLLEGR